MQPSSVGAATGGSIPLGLRAEEDGGRVRSPLPDGLVAAALGCVGVGILVVAARAGRGRS